MRISFLENRLRQQQQESISNPITPTSNSTPITPTTTPITSTPITSPILKPPEILSPAKSYQPSITRYNYDPERMRRLNRESVIGPTPIAKTLFPANPFANHIGLGSVTKDEIQTIAKRPTIGIGLMPKRVLTRQIMPIEQKETIGEIKTPKRARNNAPEILKLSNARESTPISISTIKKKPVDEKPEVEEQPKVTEPWMIKDINRLGTEEKRITFEPGLANGTKPSVELMLSRMKRENRFGKNPRRFEQIAKNLYGGGSTYVSPEITEPKSEPIKVPKIPPTIIHTPELLSKFLKTE